MNKHLFKYDHPFSLESGKQLPGLQIAYHTHGKRNDAGSNVVWICHALTANSDPIEWWDTLVGKGKQFDPDRYFIVCANILASCYGSSGPLTVNPKTNKPFYAAFPQVTIRDMVQAHILLREHLGIKKIHIAAGGSMGGYQLLEWAISEPAVIENMVLLATSPKESAWGIAIHTAQRLAIETDLSWKDDSPSAGAAGLKTARAIGMLTYRNYEMYVRTQDEPDHSKTDDYKASSYIHYQGEKLVKRFNAQSYWLLSKAMDSHNIARGRGNMEQALSKIKAKTLVIGISSDILCPVAEQQYLAKHIPGAHFAAIDSPYGHDGFLIEGKQTSALIGQFI